MSAAGWRHEIEQYFAAGFDDFIAKPYRFETVCDCIERHLAVRFEHATAAGCVPGAVQDLSAARLTAPLRQRLLNAARLNAFTEIEAVLSELKTGGEEELVGHLEGLLARYDSRGILATIERLGPSPGTAPTPLATGPGVRVSAEPVD
jgi:CheY-like chemotaxis protein